MLTHSKEAAWKEKLELVCSNLPIQEAWLSSIWISESGLLSCGITTALKPNAKPVFIVPKFATNAATTWRNAFPRSCLLLYGFANVICAICGVWFSICVCCAVDFTMTGIGPLVFINVSVSLQNDGENKIPNEIH